MTVAIMASAINDRNLQTVKDYGTVSTAYGSKLSYGVLAIDSSKVFQYYQGGDSVPNGGYCRIVTMAGAGVQTYSTALTLNTLGTNLTMSGLVSSTSLAWATYRDDSSKSTGMYMIDISGATPTLIDSADVIAPTSGFGTKKNYLAKIDATTAVVFTSNGYTGNLEWNIVYKNGSTLSSLTTQISTLFTSPDLAKLAPMQMSSTKVLLVMNEGAQMNAAIFTISGSGVSAACTLTQENVVIPTQQTSMHVVDIASSTRAIAFYKNSDKNSSGAQDLKLCILDRSGDTVTLTTNTVLVNIDGNPTGIYMISATKGVVQYMEEGEDTSYCQVFEINGADEIVITDDATETGLSSASSSNELSGQSITMVNATDVSLMGLADTQGAIVG